MTDRIVSTLIGYVLGCILTAEIVAKKYAGKSAAALGDTGNPGMANIMASLGFKPGILTLAGDIGKCILACVLSYYIYSSSGWLMALYAGVGCTLGHDFPFWRKFRGGKGVATTSAATILYSPLYGILANVIGMLVVFATKYLCFGGPVIPLAFALLMLATGNQEAAILGGVLTVLSLISHGPSMLGIRKGTTKQTDVIGAIRRKFFTNQDKGDSNV